VREAWKARSASLGLDEREKFESYACDGLAEYLEKLEAACQKHRDESHAFKVIDWFEPIFKAVELFMPAAKMVAQAYPNPGSLVLGGIVGVINITGRFRDYQKLTMQMLARMGRKARILMEYENDVYKTEYRVQCALIDVYGDILSFCQKALRFATENGKLLARVKGFRLLMFRDYESQLGKEVQDFENHIEDLEALACLCDKKRLQELHDSLGAHHETIGQVVAENREHFQRRDDIIVQLWKRDQELIQRLSV
jgi:hypothetical protein